MKENYLDIVNKFINKYDDNNLIGIIVYGSYVNNKNNDSSDIDIMLIKKDYDTRDALVTILDGVKVECFINGLNNLYEDINLEKDYNDVSHLTKFMTGKILVDKTGDIKKLVDYIGSIYNNLTENRVSQNDKFLIWSINNKLDDLFELQDSIEFYSVYFVILEKIRILYMKINGNISLPLTKFKKLIDNPEYAQEYINSNVQTLPSNEFISKYIKCLSITDKSIMYNNLMDLYNFSFKKVDFNVENFCLSYLKNPPWRV